MFVLFLYFITYLMFQVHFEILEFVTPVIENYSTGIREFGFHTQIFKASHALFTFPPSYHQC